MGAWGPAIFSDDTASDIREEYRAAIANGASAEAAREKILASYTPRADDPNYAAVVWLALALTEWNLGRLEDRVRFGPGLFAQTRRPEALPLRPDHPVGSIALQLAPAAAIQQSVVWPGRRAQDGGLGRDRGAGWGGHRRDDYAVGWRSVQSGT